MKPTSSACKQIAVSAFLALALLGAQSAAMLHWLAHSIDAAQRHATRGEAGGATAARGDATSRHKPDAGGFAVADHCDACLAFGALGTGAAAAELTVALTSAATSIASAADVGARPATCRLAFRSRAPPALV